MSRDLELPRLSKSPCPWQRAGQPGCGCCCDRRRSGRGERRRRPLCRRKDMVAIFGAIVRIDDGAGNMPGLE